MPHHQKNTIVSITTLFAFLIGYFLLIFPLESDQIAPQSFGRSLLIIMGICMLTGIICYIFLTIIENVMGYKPSELIDERDRMIEAKSSGLYKHIASIGFMLAIIFMAFFDKGYFAAFHFMAIALALGDLIENIYKLMLRHRGHI